MSLALNQVPYQNQVGTGEVAVADTLSLINNPTQAQQYSNAQVANYDHTRQFVSMPPLRMVIEARCNPGASTLQGTAGFGFWNHPFAPNERGFRLPQAVWFFFASPPSNMALALDVPGYGWKCATMNARRWQFLAMLPTAPLGFLLMRNKWLYHRLWSIGQTALGVSEYALNATLLNEWHLYQLDWYDARAVFWVDGVLVHQTQQVPRSALGFVIWMDNQYAVVTPQGRFQFGVLDIATPQALEIRTLQIDSQVGVVYPPGSKDEK